MNDTYPIRRMYSLLDIVQPEYENRFSCMHGSFIGYAVLQTVLQKTGMSHYYVTCARLVVVVSSDYELALAAYVALAARD